MTAATVLRRFGEGDWHGTAVVSSSEGLTLPYPLTKLTDSSMSKNFSECRVALKWRFMATLYLGLGDFCYFIIFTFLRKETI